MGVEPPYKTVYEPIGNGQFNAVVDTNYSNPDQWANPEGYTYIENSKGTTILDRNFVQVYPCLLYTSPSPRDAHESRMPSSA